MSQKGNKLLMNFVGGELSPQMAARTDLDTYLKGLSWCQNFMILPQGGATYVPGTFLCGLTKNIWANAWLIRWQFSANDAIMIVAAAPPETVPGSGTGATLRFYRNNAVILNTAVNITGITNGTTMTVTASSHGYSVGQEVYITGVNGMNQVNNRFFLVASTTTNTFTVNDQYGNNVNSVSYGTYVSGGTVASIYEFSTPYLAGDLNQLRMAQIGDLMYITCQNPAATRLTAYPPAKLTRSGFTNWSFNNSFTRTNDPFTPTNFVPNAITAANPPQVTVSSGTTGLSNGTVLYVTGVGGMTQLNGNFYQVANLTSTTFTLSDLSGNPINGSGFSAFTSGGNFTMTNLWPAVCAFSADGRLTYADTFQNTEGWWASELASGTTTQYDNFTTGSADTNAMIYGFAPVGGIIDSICGLYQFGGNFALLGASSIRQVYGSSPGTPATPTSISTLPTMQGAYKADPLVINWDLIFIDVNQQKLRGMQYNLAFSDFQAQDYNLLAERIGEEASFLQLAYVKGIPEVIYVLRSDGMVMGFTFNNIEKINAWWRLYPGGGGKVISIASIRNSNGNDQLWMLVQRTINGQNTVSVEVMSQRTFFPEARNFYSGGISAVYGPPVGAPANVNNLNTDTTNWQNYAWEQGKYQTFLNMSITYDGHARGTSANATLTPSGTTGTITITSNQSVFQTSDVGSQIWKDYTSTGAGGGQATISGYTSPTQVTAVVQGNFDTTNAIAPGMWGFAVNQLVNLQLFNNTTISIATDGGTHPPQPVINGAITLQWYSQVIQVGFGYVGLLSTMNIAPGLSRTGPDDNKPRTIKRIRARFCETQGGWIGSSEYYLQEVIFRQGQQIANRVPPPFTGTQDVPVRDQWSAPGTLNGPAVEKQVVLVQVDPTPCTLLSVDVEMESNDPIA